MCDSCKKECKCKVQPHPHAELMMQYAIDAQTTDKPWELWEHSPSIYGPWYTAEESLHFYSTLFYRRKQKTININGFEVPEPLYKAPTYNQKYWVINLTNSGSSLVVELKFRESSFEKDG